MLSLNEPQPLIFYSDIVVLDHRICEKLPAHSINLLARLCLIGGFEIDLNKLALPHIAHTFKTEGGQGMSNCLALWIKDAVF